MGNGCAAPVPVVGPIPEWLLETCRQGFSHAKNGEKVDLERAGLLDQTARFRPAGEHSNVLASEHLIQNGAAE